MDKLQVFNNTEFGSIRTVEIDNEAWFVGKDVAEILGYANPRKAIGDHVDKEDKGVTKCDTPGGAQNFTVINESGLYSLVLSSKLPTAKKFKKWVTGEVLPTIRKHGAYMTPEKIKEVLTNPDTIIELATTLKAEQERNQALYVENVQQKQIIGELQAKADYTDLILKNKSLVTITQIAKDYGMSGQAMNEELHRLGVQYKMNDQWLLYAKYHNKGYTHSETISFNHADGKPDTKMNTKWTQKGRLFIYELLKKEGIIPVIEREIAG